MFAKTPAKDGVPLVGTNWLHEGRSISQIEAIAYFEPTKPLEVEWAQLTEVEYLFYWRAGLLSTDKSVIKADGVDVATIEAEAYPGLAEITFYCADTGEIMAIVPVDQQGKATLPLKATKPGIMKIRAGEPTVTRLNEVLIKAD